MRSIVGEGETSPAVWVVKITSIWYKYKRDTRKTFTFRRKDARSMRIGSSPDHRALRQRGNE